MPRYMVRRVFSEGLHIPIDSGGADVCRAVIEHNAEEGVTWVSSFVSEDKTQTFCIYDAPNPARRKRPWRGEAGTQALRLGLIPAP